MKNSPLIFICIAFCGLCLLDSCGHSSDTESHLDQAVLDDSLIVEYMADSITATRDASGVYYYARMTNPDPTARQPTVAYNILSIYYVEGDITGKVYERINVVNYPVPPKLRYGVNAVYPVGLDIGLEHMKEGETFVFLIPSALAYGSYTTSLIPENAILKIELTLVSVQNDMEVSKEDSVYISDFIVDASLNNLTTHPTDSVKILPSGIWYKRLSLGTVDDTLRIGDEATFQYIARFPDDLDNFFDRTVPNDPFTYTFGQNQIIAGIPAGLDVMEHGESAYLIMPSSMAYGESVFVSQRRNTATLNDLVALNIIPAYSAKVPPFTVVVFETTLE